MRYRCPPRFAILRRVMKLLIVEDHAPLRALLKRLLRPLAGEIGECADGAEAFAAYAAQRPDWVLMDIRMPLVDGLTATRQIRAFDPAARVVIVTDFESAELREEARAAGACAYIHKENLPALTRLLRAAAAE